MHGQEIDGADGYDYGYENYPSYYDYYEDYDYTDYYEYGDDDELDYDPVIEEDELAGGADLYGYDDDEYGLDADYGFDDYYDANDYINDFYDETNYAEEEIYDEGLYDDTVYPDEFYEEEGLLDEELYDEGVYDEGVYEEGVYEDEEYGYLGEEDLVEPNPWYGYDDRYEEDNWFYDYWDEGYIDYYDIDADDDYDVSYEYVDRDGDGLYDGYYAYRDWDNDAQFENADYVSFEQDMSQRDRNRLRQRQQQAATKRQISGQIARMKRVSVRDTKHMVVMLQVQDDQRVLADLGPVQDLQQLDLRQGDRIQVQGPMVKVGNERILMAQSLRAGDGRSMAINRRRARLTGQVAGTRTVNIRDGQHLVLRLAMGANRTRLVDLGPINQIDMQLQQGDRVEVTGAPVEINNRMVLFAHTITRDGETAQIHRQVRRQDGQRASGEREADQTVQQRRQGRRQQRQDRQRQRLARLSGRIEGLREVSVRGTERGMAELRTNEDRRFLVDLGPVQGLPATFQQGDRVTVRGIPVRAGNQRALLARRVERNGQTITISGRGPEDRLRSISGQIVSTRTAQIRGRTHRLAEVQTRQNNQILLDMGPAENVRGTIEEGDQVTARGTLLRVQGRRPVLVARVIELEGGETIRVSRRPANPQ